MEEEVDFLSFFKQFDTVLMGRKTYDLAQKGMGAEMPGMHTIAFSRTIPPSISKVEFANDAVKTVLDLKAKPGKDIWLFGGGELFRSLLDAKLVDTIEVGIMPILLSEGIPILPAGARSPRLRLMESKPTSAGIVGLSYAIEYAS